MALKDKIKFPSLKGRVAYNNSVVNSIVCLAVAEVDGVAPDAVSSGEKNAREKFAQKISIDIDKDKIFIDISIYVYYNFSVPDVAYKVQEEVKNSIENMTSFKVTAVDIRVLGVVFKENTNR